MEYLPPVWHGYADAKPSESIQKDDLPGLAVAVIFPWKRGSRSGRSVGKSPDDGLNNRSATCTMNRQPITEAPSEFMQQQSIGLL